MIIYTLTETYTQHSFSPKEVFTFVSHEEAHKTMIDHIHTYLTSVGFEVTKEELNNPNGYENGEVCVGYDYAKDDAGVVLWEIFKTEISMRETIIGNLMAYIRETYKTPARFDDVLYRLINEYKDEDLNAIASESDFVEEHIIGEALYENAVAELGGKNGEYYYGKILEYLNESDQFINVRCTMFNYWDLPIEEEKLENWQRWFIGMLTICDGNKTMINLVREDIDDKQPKGDKIFELDTKKEFVESHSNVLPQNHRNLCSKWTDEQYYEIMHYILNYKFNFGYGENYYKQMVHLYEEMKYVIFKIIQNYGIDVLLDTYYGTLIDIKDTPEVGWYIYFVGDPYENASMVDDLQEKYKNLF